MWKKRTMKTKKKRRNVTKLIAINNGILERHDDAMFCEHIRRRRRMTKKRRVDNEESLNGQKKHKIDLVNERLTHIQVPTNFEFDKSLNERID